MSIPEPERNEKRFNAKLTPTLKRQLEEEAKKRNVSEGSALRYILSLYFAGDLQKTKVDCCHKESEPTP
jgi:hypothetical protein